MVYYLQRENNTETEITFNSIVRFETSLALSETQEATPTEDFIYNVDGSIDILRAGTYSIFWYITEKTSFSTIGQSYHILRTDYSLPSPDWVEIAGASNHIKVSQTSGFAVIDVTADEINAFGRSTIALFNTADADAELTFFVQKAGILIYGIDLDTIEQELSDIDEEINTIFNDLQAILNFVHLSDVTNILSLNPALSGLGVSVINSGFSYNFWGTGTLNHQQTLNAGETYYLITSAQYPPLSFYVGASTIGTLWIETPAPTSEIFSFPIRFDNTGIFFIPDVTYTNLPLGTTFKFTQSLILVDPNLNL